LTDYAARKGATQSLVVEAALASHLSPDGNRSPGGRAGATPGLDIAADRAARKARQHFQ